MNLFTKNKRGLIILLAAAALIFINLYQFNRNQEIKKRYEVAQQNIKALADSIRIVKETNGKFEFNKLALLTDKLSGLEQLNRDLAAEVKTIKGTVNTIIKADVKIVHDTVPLVVHGQLIDSTVTALFDYSKAYSPGNARTLQGYTKYDIRTGNTTGELTKDELDMRFKTGIKNLDKGKPEIFLQSDYPGFNLTSLDGAVLDPTLFHKKPTVHLITVGFGVGLVPLTYDWRTQKAEINLHRVGVTAGLNFNFSKILKPNK